MESAQEQVKIDGCGGSLSAERTGHGMDASGVSAPPRKRRWSIR